MAFSWSRSYYLLDKCTSFDFSRPVFEVPVLCFMALMTADKMFIFASLYVRVAKALSLKMALSIKMALSLKNLSFET